MGPTSLLVFRRIIATRACDIPCIVVTTTMLNLEVVIQTNDTGHPVSHDIEVSRVCAGD